MKPLTAGRNTKIGYYDAPDGQQPCFINPLSEARLEQGC